MPDGQRETATTCWVTYENEWVFQQDEEACDEYQAYLAEHDAYRIRGGILYADDFVEWLNDSRIGQRIRDRICSERTDDLQLGSGSSD